MLDKNDLQAIAELMTAMEKRMDEKLEQQKQDVFQAMNVIIENKVQTQLNLLGEQQRLILEKITPAETIEDLKAQVSTLEFVVKDLSADVRKLKAAN